MKKEIYSLTCLKGICAILVVLIHTHIVGKVTVIPFYRCAVPLFFMISGYFLMGTNGVWHREKIGRYIKKMLLIWIVTNGVYIVFSQFVFTDYKTFDDARNFFHELGMEVIFGGQFCYPLWYVTAYVWTLVILRFWECQYCKANVVIIGILLLINILLGTYSFMLPLKITDSYISNNVLTAALPFVMMGGFLKLYLQNHSIHVSMKGWIFLLMCCYAELAFLYFMDSRNGDVFVTTPLLSILIFIWFASRPELGQYSLLRNVGKKYSLSMYLLHVLAIWAVNTYSNRLGIPIREYEFALVLVLTMLICYALRKIGNIILNECPQTSKLAKFKQALRCQCRHRNRICRHSM